MTGLQSATFSCALQGMRHETQASTLSKPSGPGKDLGHRSSPGMTSLWWALWTGQREQVQGRDMLGKARISSLPPLSWGSLCSRPVPPGSTGMS